MPVLFKSSGGAGRRAFLLICVLLAWTLVGEAIAQSGPGRRGRRGAGRSPQTQFTAGEAREFVALATKAFAWSKSERGSANAIAADDVADFFGLRAFRTAQFRLRATQAATSTNLYAQAGMAFLSALDSKQRKILETVVARQQGSFPQHAALHSRILEHLQRGRVNFADHENEVIRLTIKRREVEGAIALDQARGFRSLSLTMSREQMDYLVNFRRGLTSGPFVAYGETEAADLMTHLKQMPGTSRARLLETAEEAFNWLTGNLAGNLAMDSSDIAPFFAESAALTGDPAPATPPKNGGMKNYGKGKTGNPFEGLAGMLDWRQRRIIRNLIEEEKPLFAKFTAERRRLVAELYKLRSGESLNEKRIAALSQSLGETEGKIVLLQAKTFGYLDTVFRPDQLARVVISKPATEGRPPSPRVATK